MFTVTIVYCVTDEPEAPASIRVTEYWSDHITVAWEPPASDGGSPLTGYNIEKRDALRSTWVKAGTVEPGVTSFKCENLFEGADYLFRVFAENKVGPSLKAAEMDTTVKAKMPFGEQQLPCNIMIQKQL